MYLIETTPHKMTAYVWDTLETPKKLVGIFSEYDAKKVIALLNAERFKFTKQLPRVRKVIPRDVAQRYIERFGGSTRAVQIAADDAIVYLRNADGDVLGPVTQTDKYPRETALDFSTMPF